MHFQHSTPGLLEVWWGHVCTCGGQCLCTDVLTLISSFSHTTVFPGSSMTTLPTVTSDTTSSGPEGPLLGGCGTSVFPFDCAAPSSESHCLWCPPRICKSFISDDIHCTSLSILGYSIIFSFYFNLKKCVWVYCLHVCLQHACA